MPNNGKVKVTINVQGAETVYFLDHYHTLNIEPFVEDNGNKHYLRYMFVNDENIICTPKLYLDKYIKTVELTYSKLRVDSIGMVLESIGNVSLKNYLPQIGLLSANFSFPRASIYKGVKFGQKTLHGDIFAFPVDLDKEDFEIWNNGIKFTLHLNRNNHNEPLSFFDIIKVEFYGELLPAEQIDDYIELKPKGD